MMSIMFDYNLFNKRSIKNKQRFSQLSFIKLEIGKRLLDKLSFIKIIPKIIYVEGLSAEDLTNLKVWFTDAKIITELSQPVDLILSNCLLHLNESIVKCLKNWQNWLKPEGIILFTSFGSTTLQELKKAWQFIDSYPHINQMVDLHDLGDLLLKQYYQNPVVDAEILTLSYDNLTILFSDIRSLGEPLADTKMRRTFIGKTRWQQFIARLEKKGLNISYEIIYGYAYKSRKSLATKTIDGEAMISFEQLQSSLRNRKT